MVAVGQVLSSAFRRRVPDVAQALLGHGQVDVLVGPVGVVGKQPAIEPGEGLGRAKTTEPQHAADVVGPELAVAEPHHPFLARRIAFSVDGLVVEPHVEQALSRVENVVGGVDELLPGDRVGELGSAPTPHWILT